MQEVVDSFVGSGQTQAKKALMVLALVFVGGFLYQWVSSPMIVTVQGVSEVSAPAKSARVSFSLTATSDSATNANDVIQARANALKQILITYGADASSINLSQVNIRPSSSVVNSGGYQAVMTMTGEVSEVARLDELVASLYERGAAVVNQPTLIVDDQEELEKQAFNEALSDAKQKVSRIGNKHFKFIRKIVAVSESTAASGGSVGQESGQGEEGLVGTDVLNLGVVRIVNVSYKMW